MSNPFSTVASGVKVGHNTWRPKAGRLLDMYPGLLYPIFNRPLMPNSYTRIRGAVKIMPKTPMLAPELTDIDYYEWFFWYPIRFLKKHYPDLDIEAIITGFDEDNDEYTELLPAVKDKSLYRKGKLTDFFGWKVFADGTGELTNKKLPSYMFHAAYNDVWNYYFRNELLQDKVAFDNNELLPKGRPRDYFTAAAPSQQKGDPVSIPIGGSISGDLGVDTSLGRMNVSFANNGTSQQVRVMNGSLQAYDQYGGSWQNFSSNAPLLQPNVESASQVTGLGAGNLNLQSGVSFGYLDISDLRAGVQTQRILERAMRCGTRYNEYLRANFAMSPTDLTIQEPMFIGGFKQPVVVNSVTQTSESGTTPQGTQRATFMSLGGGKIPTFRADEFGVLLGIACIMPKTVYAAQGIDRLQTMRSHLDFPNLSYQNLSEQEITNGELYFEGNEDDDKVFGFTGMYNEWRTGENKAVNNMRDTFNYWHLAREFSERPNLNSAFIEMNPEEMMRIFAYQKEEPFIVDCQTLLSQSLPLVKYPVPGLVDHN